MSIILDNDDFFSPSTTIQLLNACKDIEGECVAIITKARRIEGSIMQYGPEISLLFRSGLVPGANPDYDRLFEVADVLDKVYGGPNMNVRTIHAYKFGNGTYTISRALSVPIKGFKLRQRLNVQVTIRGIVTYHVLGNALSEVAFLEYVKETHQIDPLVIECLLQVAIRRELDESLARTKEIK